MRKLLFSFLLFPFLALAQTPSNPLGGNLNVVDGGTCSTAGSFLWQRLPTSAGNTTVNLAGTFSATVTVRESNNGGGTWSTAATLSSVGTSSFQTNGFTDICVDVTSYTSGIVAVSLSTGLQQVQSATASVNGGGVNTQTVGYTAVAGDNGKLIVMNGAGLTLTLPNPPPSSTWSVTVLSHPSSTGSLTIARNSLNVNGAASNITLPVGGGTTVYTDGLNYFTSSTQAGLLNGSAGSITNRVKISDQGSCTMAAGACTVPIALASTYSAAPQCFATWTGTGTLTGFVKVTSSTTQITALTSSVGTDTAQVNWICFGN
jgi:hypothetical protein